MTPSPPPQSPDRGPANECKEDAEFVECLECGDIFESSEFKDMIIEDTRLKNEF
jgi:hypothetical protein